MSPGTVKNAKRAMKEGSTIAPSPARDEAKLVNPLKDAAQPLERAERLKADMDKNFTRWEEQNLEEIGLELMIEIILAVVRPRLDKYKAALSR